MIRAKIEQFAFQGSETPLLSKTEFAACASQVTCLVGGSGVGKSTLLRILLGILPTGAGGHVLYQVGDDCFNPAEARKLGCVGVMAQTTSLLPWLTVRENMCIPSQLNHRLFQASDEDIFAVFGRLGLSRKVLGLQPHQLSFGMQQRVSFARAIVYKPTFLLLDEVFNGLDTVNADALLNEIHDYVHAARASCILVTHDVDRALAIADALLYLNSTGQLRALPCPLSRETLIAEFQNDVVAGVDRIL